MYDSMVLMMNPLNEEDSYQLAFTGSKKHDRRYQRIAGDLKDYRDYLSQFETNLESFFSELTPLLTHGT